MKRLILSILFFGFVGNFSFSQNLLGFESFSGNDRNDFKAAEPKALEAANYLLSTAIDENLPDREKALKYMLMWMEGTPDYVFYIDGNINVFTRSNELLLKVYMACLTKLSLENRAISNDRDELKLKSVEAFMEYCLNPENHVESYRQLEKMVKARNKNKLSEFVLN